jgi:hypothetical protein
VLYVIASESASDAKLDVRDKITGAHIRLSLPGQRAAMALVGKRERAVIARYGF